MKKVIALCFFALALFLGSQTISAQTSIIEVNKKASERTEELRKFIKFDDNQRNQVYAAYQEYMQATLDLKQVSVVEEGVKEKINKLLDDKIRTILTEEQYVRFKEFTKD
ncbi:hypothetical protein [Winogradskyella alexanderae]|jgi:hypothetical protein|uniref:Uncharacterized protein n=1 Tax=Winogradskyella alexanderae TaxID=2877123 RepID=A0ABS7XTA0_9FLAO|nr:hypothetical protein [Winogradskyella alexanderae]MCA0133261.1 hypothetical protein [Winogradskyella alexanderae]